MKTQPIYAEGVRFIKALRAEGVPLKAIVTSDWHSSSPSVYIDVRGMKKKGFPLDYSKWQRGTRCGYHSDNLRRCQRFDRLGLIQAVNWYAKKIIYVAPQHA